MTSITIGSSRLTHVAVTGKRSITRRRSDWSRGRLEIVAWKDLLPGQTRARIRGWGHGSSLRLWHGWGCTVFKTTQARHVDFILASLELSEATLGWVWRQNVVQMSCFEHSRMMVTTNLDCQLRPRQVESPQTSRSSSTCSWSSWRSWKPLLLTPTSLQRLLA